MSLGPEGPQGRRGVRLTAREWVAVVLSILGVGLVVTGAWLIDVTWGIITLGVCCALYGILLGSGR